MGELQQQIARYQRMQIALGVLALVMVVGTYCGSIRPSHARQQEMLAAADVERQALSSAKVRVAVLPTMEHDVAELKGRLEHFDKQLPKKPDMDQFVRDVNKVSEQTALKKMTVTPGSPRRGELFSEMPISLNFSGDFSSVVSFLKQTENMQRLTRVRSMQVRSKDVTSGNVEVDLSVSIYFADE